MDQEKLIQLTITKLMNEATAGELAKLDELTTDDAASSFFVQAMTDYFTAEYQHNDVDAPRLFKNIKEKLKEEKE
ncbi:hypothetical protein [Mucilaginibacter dorajii]|uniref:Uncharacterized protein n=1 Tax=Mucilaginibacter dorajii TaxID=692994 RepID=A0ABP7Q8W1_9SPHI|nr:hypothetical protein [Mucilaginibacter dorajii]MCS3737086.1 alpha-D-ribose 1-methylphosphonate 5-phosphate C-P lyase [Mucilaginibacter dorajii]